MFIKTLTTNDKYFLGNSENLPKPIQMQLSKKKKNAAFLLQFSNLHSILNLLRQKVNLISYVFPKLRMTKYMVWQVSKRPCFWTPFNSQNAKGYQTPVKSAWQQFYQMNS